MSTPLPLPTGIRSHLPDLFARMYNPFSQDPKAEDALSFTVEPSQAHASLEISGATATLHLSRPAVTKTPPVYFPDIIHPVVYDGITPNPSPNLDSFHWTPAVKVINPWSEVLSYHAGDYVYNPDDDTVYFCVTTPPAVSNVLASDNFHRPNQVGGWGTSAFGRPWMTDDSVFMTHLSIHDNKALVQYDESGNIGTWGLTFPWIQFGTTPVSPTEAYDVVVTWYYTLHDGFPGNFNIGWDVWLNAEDVIPEGVFFPNKTGPMIDGVQDDGFIELDFQGYGYSAYPYTYSAPVRTNNTVYHTRVRANRPFFGVRTWVSGTPEPTTWDLSHDTRGTSLGAMTEHFTGIAPFFHSTQAFQQLFFTDVSVYSVVNAAPWTDTLHWRQIEPWSDSTSYPDIVTVSLGFSGATGIQHEDNFQRDDNPSDWGANWALTNYPGEFGTAHILGDTGYLVSDISFDSALMIWDVVLDDPLTLNFQAQFMVPDNFSEIIFLFGIDPHNPFTTGDRFHISMNYPFTGGFQNIYWAHHGDFTHYDPTSVPVTPLDTYTVYVTWNLADERYDWRLVRDRDADETNGGYGPSELPTFGGIGVWADTNSPGQNVQVFDIKTRGPVPVTTTVYGLFDQPVAPDLTPDAFDLSVTLTQDVSFNLANSPDSDNQAAIPSIGHLASITRDEHLVTLPSLEDFLRSTGDRFFNTDLITWTVSVPPDNIKPLAALSLIDGTYA